MGVGLEMLRRWCEEGYAELKDTDDELAARWAVRPSVKLTSIKPSGTVSLVAGASPGLHWPESRYYLRRIRMASNDSLIGPLREAGYPMEPDVTDQHTMVVTVPVAAANDESESLNMRTLDDLSMWEQMLMAAFMQRHWADNQVSCTVTFDPATEGPHIAAALAHFQYMLKGISFLPRPKSVVVYSEGGSLDDKEEEEERQLAAIEQPYPQMPYERISRREYHRLSSNLSALQFHMKAHTDGAREGGATADQSAPPDAFCDSDRCVR